MRFAFDELFRPGSRTPSGWARMPAVARECMVATSHPLATRAGLEALGRGGNAVDAALAAAAMLTVTEPTDNGPGGDAFAIVWRDGRLHGFNGSGRSPALLAAGARAEATGPRSVTVPGAVRLWADLAERFGRLGLEAALAPAAATAERGHACTARIAHKWRHAEHQPWPAPALGGIVRLPELGATLRRIAADGPDAFYTGALADAIAAASWLSPDDLAAHRTEEVEPLRLAYGGVEVCELPPNGQGAAALRALGIYDGLPHDLHHRIEAVKLGLADTRAVVHDGPLPAGFLDRAELDARRALVRPDAALDPALALPRGGTTYLCAVDGDGTAVSLIQSIYQSFGSGVLVPGTGVVLQNRAAGFSPDPEHPNALGASRRPFHTIIPGMLLEGGGLLGPFGVMGGPMQPQGHFQVVAHLVDEGMDPQSALDAPRFRVDEDRVVVLEPGLWSHEPELASRGHVVRRAEVQHEFGVGQAILRLDAALVGGSDSRGDGYAAGW